MVTSYLPPSRVAGIEDYRRLPRFNVAENAKILLRCEYLERRLLRIMAGWIPGTARWEAKQLLGRLVWEDAEHTQSLRNRILELRTSERILDRPPSQHLALVMDELPLADDWCEFLVGVAAVKQALLEAYERHIAETQPLVDQPTVRLLRILVAEETEHLALLEEQIAAGSLPAEQQASWRERIRKLLAAAGGVRGLDAVNYTITSEELRSSTRTFHCDYDYAADERFGDRRVPRFLAEDVPYTDDAAGFYRAIGVGRLAEMQAAQGLALSLYENDGQPWEYYYLTARHLWDEMRHSAMGGAMLEDAGVDWTKIPLWTGNYQFYAQLTPLQRTIRLGVVIELAAMESGHKRHEVEMTRKHGLALAETFQDYDWADEVNHVEYARRAIELMLKGDLSSLEGGIEEVKRLYAEFRAPWESAGGTF